MFRPVIQKTRVLVGMAVFNLLMFFIASHSLVTVKSRGYELKLQAAAQMQQAMDELKEYRLGSDGIFIDSTNDPNETALIGSQFGPITTDEGDLDAKLTTLNPNFASLVLDMFLELGMSAGDTVAVSLTGSMPGANLAVFAACKTLDVTPVIITSVGASQWGANDPYFTWLDMESVLLDRGVFSYQSAAASIGGKGDVGKGVSMYGRELLWESIYRNQIPLIQEDSLVAAIGKRMQVYGESAKIADYSALVNVGGGASSIGPSINSRLIPDGISYPNELMELSGSSVVREFSREGIPVIHILDIRNFSRDYQIPWAPIPTPTIGEGPLYSEQRYNFWVTLVCLFSAIGSVIGVGIYSHKQIKERMATYEPDSIL
ncbi:MAG: poly-gamma-glutamate system protein [Candidatus Marinimicrobia bacterium]|nr:poly-gamma-glutamate system protein [Candidatus Neomarinimicrobiota bacterium]